MWIENPRERGGNVINKKMLKAAMVMSGMTQGDLAKAMGMSTPSMNYRINGKREFSISEIQMLCELLELSDEQKLQIFLKTYVENKSTSGE